MSANLVAVTRQQPLFIERPDEMWEFHGESYEDHLDCWQIIDEQVQKDKWKLSSVAASLDVKYKDKTIDRFAHDIRRSARRVREYAQTYRAFENGGRAPILSFSHHIAAASHNDPVAAIQKAHDGEWSVHELEKWIRTGEEPRQAPKEPETPTEAMRALHDKAVRDELDEKIAIVRGWLTATVDPSLCVVYSRLIEALEWQRDRTLETDCAAILKSLSGDEGAEAPLRISDRDLAAWLHDRGFIMPKDELGTGGCPSRCTIDHKHVERGGRLGLMVRLKMFTVETREDSRGEEQRGGITFVYALEIDFFEALDEIDGLPHKPERVAALHKDWMRRLERYAPELLPKKEEVPPMNK